MFVAKNKKKETFIVVRCVYFYAQAEDTASQGVTIMLVAKQQWCPRCQRHVQTEQKRSNIGRQKELVRITVTCFKCRTTLSSKTTSAAALEQNEDATPKE